MDRLEALDAETPACRKAQPRARQRRPEAVDLAREVMALGRREYRRVDADEDDIEPSAQQVGKRGQRFRHDAFLHYDRPMSSSTPPGAELARLLAESRRAVVFT